MYKDLEWHVRFAHPEVANPTKENSFKSTMAFLDMCQDNNESLPHYVARLSRNAAYCNFVLPVGENDYTEKMIQHQLVHGLADQELRHTVLNDSDLEQTHCLQELLDKIESRGRSRGCRTISCLPKRPKERRVGSASTATSTTCVECSKLPCRSPDQALCPKTSASPVEQQRTCDKIVDSNLIRFPVDGGEELVFEISENKYFCTTCSSKTGARKGLAKSSVRLHARTKHYMEIKSWTRGKRRAIRLEAVHRCPTCTKECRRAKITKGFATHIGKCTLKKQRLAEQFMTSTCKTTCISSINKDQENFEYTLASPKVATNYSEESRLPALAGENVQEVVLDILVDRPSAINPILDLNGETLIQIGEQQTDKNPQDLSIIQTLESQIFGMDFDEYKIEEDTVTPGLLFNRPGYSYRIL